MNKRFLGYVAVLCGRTLHSISLCVAEGLALTSLVYCTNRQPAGFDISCGPHGNDQISKRMLPVRIGQLVLCSQAGRHVWAPLVQFARPVGCHSTALLLRAACAGLRHTAQQLARRVPSASPYILHCCQQWCDPCDPAGCRVCLHAPDHGYSRGLSIGRHYKSRALYGPGTVSVTAVDVNHIASVV